MRQRSRAGRAGVAWLAIGLLAGALPGCALRGGALTDLEDLGEGETLPPFWRVESPRGASLSLLGAVHFGPPGGWVFPPAVERAFDDSSALVVEIDPSEVAGTHLQVLIARYGMLAPGTTLRDRVSPEAFAFVVEHAERANLPLDAIERMQPWLVANLLVTDSTRRLGYTSRSGVDVDFTERAGERSVVALESAEYQLSLLAGLPDELQELVLLDSVGRFEDVDDYLRKLIGLWRVGDVPGLEAIFFEDAEADGVHRAFVELVILRRNLEMAERLRVLLDAEQHHGEDVFAVIGAGHLVGERGIPAILEGWGYRVTRIGRDALLRTQRHGGAVAGRP